VINNANEGSRSTKKSNREARARERLELKTLRSQVAKIRELIEGAPIPEAEVIPAIEKILSASPTPALSPYWQRQRDLATQANNKGDTIP